MMIEPPHEVSIALAALLRDGFMTLDPPQVCKGESLSPEALRDEAFECLWTAYAELYRYGHPEIESAIDRLRQIKGSSSDTIDSELRALRPLLETVWELFDCLDHHGSAERVDRLLRRLPDGEG